MVIGLGVAQQAPAAVLHFHVTGTASGSGLEDFFPNFDQDLVITQFTSNLLDPYPPGSNLDYYEVFATAYFSDHPVLDNWVPLQGIDRSKIEHFLVGDITGWPDHFGQFQISFHETGNWTRYLENGWREELKYHVVTNMCCDPFRYNGTFGLRDLAYISSYYLTDIAEFATSEIFDASGNRVSYEDASVIYTASYIGADLPEPDIWALMILGFGGIGAVARRSRSIARA